MNLRRYDPTTTRPMRRMFDGFFDRSFAPLFDRSEMGTLPLDISETDHELIVRASLPGFEAEDIDVQVHQGMLTITAQRKWDESREDERYHRRERRWSSVTRQVVLPAAVQDAEDIQGELKNGELTLRIPLPEQAKPRRIEIRGGDSGPQAISTANGHAEESMEESRDMDSMATGETAGQPQRPSDQG